MPTILIVILGGVLGGIIGATVHVWKSVMGKEYQATGSVVERRMDHYGRLLIYVADDWWVAVHGFDRLPYVEDCYEIVGEADAACSDH